MNRNRRISKAPGFKEGSGDHSSTTPPAVLNDGNISTSKEPLWKDGYCKALSPTLDETLPPTQASDTTIDYHTTPKNPRGGETHRPTVQDVFGRRPAMAVKKMYMAGDIPRFVVAFTSPIWRKVKELAGETCFESFLRQYRGWKHFWQFKDTSAIIYFPPHALPGKISYKKVIGMKLVGEEWMACVEAETDIGPKDIGDNHLAGIIAKFCEKTDWTDLF